MAFAVLGVRVNFRIEVISAIIILGSLSISIFDA